MTSYIRYTIILVPTTKFVLQGIQFEWDDQKALANVRKHNVSFERACEAFFDPFLYVVDEDEYAGNELREKIIGIARDWRILYVVYVMRDDRIRVISARDATVVERVRYEAQ